MPNIKNRKIGLKIVNGNLIGLGYYKVFDPINLTELKINKAKDSRSSTRFFSVIENAKKIVMILPPELVSFKLLRYPFKLKNKKNIELLALTALEELTPLNLDEIVILKHKLSINSLFIEYAKKKNIIDLLSEYGLLNIKKNIEIYFPYSLLYKISKNLGIKGAEDFALIYGFANEFYGIVIKDNILSEIVDLNYLNGLTDNSNNANEFKNKLGLEIIKDSGDFKNLTVYDLNDKVKEIYANQTSSSFCDDLMFLLAKESDKNKLLHLNSNSILKKTEDKNVLFKVIPVIFLVLLSLIIITFVLAENLYYKNSEKIILEKEINIILSKYMPGQKFFYEPKYEIKRYYDKLKENNSSYSKGVNFLKFLKYVSNEKSILKSLTVDSINYSYDKFNFRGKIKGYKNLHNLEIYLKKRYSSVDVVKSYNNSRGLTKFSIVLKK